MRDCDPYSLDEKVIQCANPLEFTRRPSPEMALKEVLIEEHITLNEENVKQNERQQSEEKLEGNSNADNEVPWTDHPPSPGPDDDGLSPQEMSMDDEKVDIQNGYIDKEPTPQTTPQPRLKLTFTHSNLEKDTHPIEPLQYGDLVVVDYAEKRKVHKWPAIVFLLLTKSNLDCPPRSYDR